MFSFFTKKTKTIRDLHMVFLYVETKKTKNEPFSCTLSQIHVIDMMTENKIKQIKFPIHLSQISYTSSVMESFMKYLNGYLKNDCEFVQSGKKEENSNTHPITLDYCNILKDVNKKYKEGINNVLWCIDVKD
jgi:hypothetical protein